MISAVIFDVDGTLVDSVDFHAESWQRAFRHFGKEVPYEQVRFQIGKGSDQFLPEFWSQEEMNDIGDSLDEFRTELFRREYLPRVRGFPQTRELFQHILERGQKIALASSAKSEELTVYKRAAKIGDLIEAETSADDADRSKPHPDIFQAALGRLQNPPAADTCVIGDTPWDIQAAAKAGIRTVALLSGGFAPGDLKAAVAIYQDPAELLARYDESPLAK